MWTVRLFAAIRTRKSWSFATVWITTAIQRRPTVRPSRHLGRNVTETMPICVLRANKRASMECWGVTIPTTKTRNYATSSIMIVTVKSMRTSPIPTERDFRIVWTMMMTTTALQTI